MTVRSHAYIRFVPMHSIASLLVLRSFVRRAVSWTSTLSSGKRAPLRSTVQSLDQFTQAYFGFAVGLDHHADDGGKDHLISGLNTTGSLIPITFSVNMTQDALGWWAKLRAMCGGGFRPTIFCNMTSTLMVFRDRTISVVN